MINAVKVPIPSSRGCGLICEMIPVVERYRGAQLYIVSLFGVVTLISLAGASVAAWHRSWLPLVIFLLAFLYFASRVRSLANRLAQGRDAEHE